MDQRLTRDERLHLKREFDRLFENGRAFHFPELLVRAAPNERKLSRLGLSVGRRVGNAVRRNRAKRLLREAYRLNKGLLTVPCDIVMVPRQGWRTSTFAAIEPTVQKALSAMEKTFRGG